jgi:hypothetical protein
MLGVNVNIDRPPFNYWFIYPIDIPAGKNILEAVGNNFTDIAGLGVELYDATKADLKAATSDVDLGSKLLFRASDEDGNTIPFERSDTDGYHGYECLPGYSLVTCNGQPYCQKKLFLECGQVVAEVGYNEMTYNVDCSTLSYPNLLI